MYLSEHFTLSELTASETAARRGLDNTPSAAAQGNLKRLAGVLEEIRALQGRPLIVTSGYRSPAVNRAVGGSPSSAHMTGLAADISMPPLTPFELGQLIIGAGIEFDQLIHEYRSWVHIGLAPEGQTPRRQQLTIRTGTGYMPGWKP